MEFLCIGLSYRTATLAVRERLALPCVRQVELLQRLAQAPTEALLLSTCNRVELYLASPDMAQARERAREELRLLAGDEVLTHLYERSGEAALAHLFRVASSLESLVLGEAQVLGQVKSALARSQEAGAAREELTRVLAAAFRCAKRVRTETAIGRSATSMASVAVSLAGKSLGGLAGKTALLVGAGEMAELTARHLRQAGVRHLLVCNRTLSRAELLAEEVGGTARPFEELHALLEPADVVVCGTASPLPLFTRETVALAMPARQGRPLVMVDLAVPRNIAPDVSGLEQVHAYDVDGIQQFVTENVAVRAGEARKAETLVTQEVERFLGERRVRHGVPVLARLRQHAEEIARAEVERTLSSMGEELSEQQRKRIEAMARAIVNKLLHGPTARLRMAGPVPDDNRLAGAAAELFGLGF